MSPFKLRYNNRVLPTACHLLLYWIVQGQGHGHGQILMSCMTSVHMEISREVEVLVTV